MQDHTLDDPTLAPVVCTEGDPPYYCPAVMDQLRAHTRIRCIVTIRGVPTRMTVDGSTLFSAAAPASVDAYLRHCGSVQNGNDPVRVSSSYRVDVCPGADIDACSTGPGAWVWAGRAAHGMSRWGPEDPVPQTRRALGLHAVSQGGWKEGCSRPRCRRREIPGRGRG